MEKITCGVSSDLTGDALAGANAIWDALERHHGLRAMRAALHPHVTYVVGECADLHPVREELRGAAAQLAPFEIQLDGVDVFGGPQPVVFLRVVKNPALVRAYGLMLEAMRAAGLVFWPHYLPDLWVPHVTLALQDLAPELLPRVLADLAHYQTRFTTLLETVSLVQVGYPLHAYVETLRLGG